ncbi:hypothetical protein NECAME_16253 [Necator americanus]|uniref:Uncharacterized protein n=1 Tax=Necator americanus TaxID=51031 RepID=W2TZZ3_NECAM|nr:hypothetical protein NECAME_16253 [Necator americanus]ETN86612.1 hypothetical protein NECAME_16253 [Necator americanus]
MDNIDEEYERLFEHLHDYTKKAESFKTTKRRISLETLELIRHDAADWAEGYQELKQMFTHTDMYTYLYKETVRTQNRNLTILRQMYQKDTVISRFEQYKNQLDVT